MSTIGAQKKREAREADATRPTREVLYRFSRKAGGLVVEEVEAEGVKVRRRLAHDVYDIAIAAFSAHLHRRIT